MICQLKNVYSLKWDAGVKDMTSSDMLEVSLTAFAIKPQKPSIKVTALHNRMPHCLGDTYQSV
jgi:hypothetical protein